MRTTKPSLSLSEQAKFWLRLLLINLGVLAILLLGLHQLLRGRLMSDAHEQVFLGTALDLLAPCAVVEANRDGEAIVGTATGDRSAFRFPLHKPDGVVRIAVVGESSAASLGEAMAETTRAEVGGDSVEVLNCASSGSALEHVQRRAREALGFNPDVLVVAFGQNIDLEYPLDVDALQQRQRRNTDLWASLFSDSSGDQGSAEKAPLQLRLGLLARWLLDLSRDAQARGVHLVLSTLPPNLLVLPRATRASRFEPRFLAAVYERSRGRTGTAIDLLAKMVQERSEPLWDFTYGTWLLRQGKGGEAKIHLQRAVDEELPGLNRNGDSVGRDRAPSAVNEIIRRVARSQPVHLWDLENSTQTRAWQGVPGWDVMQDHCHLRRAGFRAEAAELLQLCVDTVAPQRIDWVAQPPAPAALGIEELRRTMDSFVQNRRSEDLLAWQVGIAVEFFLRAQPDTHLEQEEIFLPADSDSSVRVYLRTGTAYGYWALGRTAAAWTMNERARAEPMAEPWVQYGLFLLAGGTLEAANAAFVRALELDPERADAAYFLGRTRQELGET